MAVTTVSNCQPKCAQYTGAEQIILCDKMFDKNVAAIAVIVFVFSLQLTSGLINGSEPNHVIDNDVPKEKTKEGERAGRSLHKECGNGSMNPKCLKIHALSWIEDLSSRDELSLLPGLSIVKENRTNAPSPEDMAAELSRQFPGNPEEKLNRFLMYRLQDYLDGHSLKYKLMDQETPEEASASAKGDKASKVTGRGKGGGGGGGGGFGGGKGGGGGLVAAALIGKGALAAAALGALALLAGKALMTALMSLLLSALVGMKGHGGGGKTTYEIIAKPEVSHHHSHSHEEHHEHEHGHHGGYRRAYDSGPYNSYTPYDTTNYPSASTMS